MSRKDYVLIADALWQEKPSVNWENKWLQYNNDVMSIARALQADNPRFNKLKFYKACGIAE